MMKKWSILLLLLTIAAASHANDAEVMPKRELRISLTPAYSIVTKRYDEDKDKEDIPFDKVSSFNLGVAFEYGLTDQITAAVEWTPGYTIWSKFDTEPLASGEAKINGLFDIFVGAKMQVIGPAGFLTNDQMRLAFEPAVVIPLPGASREDEIEKALDDEKFIYNEQDKHAFGFGAGVYFDYVINELFFVNLYGEFLYFPKKEYDDSVLYDDSEVKHGYDLTLELEPQFAIPLSEGVDVELGVAARYTTSPEREVDGTKVDNSEKYLFSLLPNATLLLRNSPVPLEFRFLYQWPLGGKNAEATNILQLQSRVSLRF